MRFSILAVLGLCTVSGLAQQQAPRLTPQQEMVNTLVGRLNLESYKATIKGLTQFGDRREGTERNRKAVDWIEAQLKSYGCETGRLTYDPQNPRGLTDEERAKQAAGRGGGGGQQAAGGRGAGTGTGQPAGGRGAGQAAGGGQGRGTPPNPVIASGEVRTGPGGSRLRGITRRTGVNNDPMAQPDEKLRALNQRPVIPGPVPMVYCTKWGTTRRGEMYIVGAHMDGIGYGEAANDDGSGTALVMELARIFSAPGVTTDVSIRFALWNGEEGGLRAANAYVAQRAKLQGTPDEPTWLGMVQHDMMLWDHGMPRADGTWNPEQRPEADVNIEFQSTAKRADEAMKLAFFFRAANERYATDYPAAVGPHMTNTDSTPFMDIVPAISLRENERGMHTQAGWSPTWHQPIDVFSTFSDKDFRLGLNAAQTTLGAIAELTGARVK